MKRAYYILTILALYSCGQPLNQETGLLAYYVGYNHNGTMRTDSIAFDRIKKADRADTLIGLTEFTLRGRDHKLSMYSSDLVAPIDGGSVYLELQGLGVIYYRSTSWLAYRRLETNNDSINEIIRTAIDCAVLHPDFCYEPGQLFKKSIDFETPEVED